MEGAPRIRLATANVAARLSQTKRQRATLISWRNGIKGGRGERPGEKASGGGQAKSSMAMAGISGALFSKTLAWQISQKHKRRVSKKYQTGMQKHEQQKVTASKHGEMARASA